MSVSSQVASQTFGAVWGLALLGMLGETPELEYPLDVRLRQYAQKHAEDIERVVERLERAVGFEPVVANMLVADAPWMPSEQGAYLPGPDVVEAEIALMSGLQPGATVSKQTYDHAIIRQLAQLLDGVVVATFQSHAPLHFESLVDILESGASLAHGRRLPLDHWLPRVLNEWHRAFRPRLESHPGSDQFARWLADAMTIIPPDPGCQDPSPER